MCELRIMGGGKLRGETVISGAKNAVLPIISSCVGLGGRAVISGCPKLTDVEASFDIIRALGGKACFENGRAEIDCSEVNSVIIPKKLGEKMRSSIIFCGGLLGRFGEVRFSRPGGCVLGERPIDIHLAGFKALGAEVIEEENSTIVKGRLKGRKIRLPYPSVGATQNIIIAACFADGKTVVYNPSFEPETLDLAFFLNACGGRTTVFKDRIEIEGAKRLKGACHRVMADRIEAGTFIAGAGIAGGRIGLTGIKKRELGAAAEVFETCGVRITESEKGITAEADGRLKAIKYVETAPYPGFPTDLQPQLTAALATADGVSIVKETVFDGRSKHIYELAKMGASIEEKDGFVIKGAENLAGAEVFAHDLRGGAALAMAALGAEGETVIKNAACILRGYEDFDKKLNCLGADARFLNYTPL